MFENVMLRDTKKEDWDGIREKIKYRIESTMGSYPEDSDVSNSFEILNSYEENNLTYIDFKYHIIDDMWNMGTCVLPEDFDKEKEYVGILAVHETNIGLGKKQIIVEDENYERAYGYELAKRGYVVIAVDQYGFGERIAVSTKKEELFEMFLEKYSGWSIDGLRLLEHKKAIDTALSFDFVKLKDSFGTIGNSQGGRGALYITAFDERIKCAAISAGVSPNATNAYRIVKHDKYLNPKLAENMTFDGRNQWEYEEFISLCAPRSVLFMEPFYDDYNPHTMATITCIYNASNIYKLLDVPEKIALFTHGDGHTTIRQTKDFAYEWMDRFLGKLLFTAN